MPRIPGFSGCNHSFTFVSLFRDVWPAQQLSSIHARRLRHGNIENARRLPAPSQHQRSKLTVRRPASFDRPATPQARNDGRNPSPVRHTVETGSRDGFGQTAWCAFNASIYLRLSAFHSSSGKCGQHQKLCWPFTGSLPSKPHSLQPGCSQ